MLGLRNRCKFHIHYKIIIKKMLKLYKDDFHILPWDYHLIKLLFSKDLFHEHIIYIS